MRSEFGLRYEQHEAEAARIVVCNDCTVLHVKHNVIVLGAGSRREGRVAKRPAPRLVFSGLAMDREPASHAEVHEEHFTAGQMCHQILGPPLQAFNTLTAETPGKALWKVKAKVGAPLLHMRKSGICEHRLQASPHNLHFGQLGHLLNRFDNTIATHATGTIARGTRLRYCRPHEQSHK